MENFNRLYKQKLKQGISIFTFQFVMLLLLLPNLLKAQTIGSSADNPFPISTVQQLATLAGQVNEGGVFYYNPSDGKYYDNNAEGYIAIANMAEGSYFKLMNDIISNHGDVASCAGVKQSDWYYWDMLGTLNHPFDGYFDGNHHTVSGLLVRNENATDGTGFCGAIANHAVIKNLGVVNSYVPGTNATGGIVGEALGGKIENCFFTGTIVTTGNYTGGLVGQMSVGTEITNSYASATISTSGNQLGGIVGKIVNSPQNCKIQNVYSSCILHGNFQYTGGIVGENVDNGTVFTNCYYDQQLIDCRVTPNSDPSSTGAGMAMTTTAMANGSWAPTGFTATGSGNNQYPYITGFSLSDDAVLFSTVPLFLPPGASLSDLSTVNTVTVGAVDGVTWTELERVGIGSFVSPTLNVIGQSYVVLKATKGSNSRTYVLQFDEAPYLGSTENPFPINNNTDLKNFRDGINTGSSFAFQHFTVPAYGLNTNFIQTANIAMPSGDNISNEESKAFKGTYDGGNHKVTNMDKAGFFGYTENATVRNLTIQCTSAATTALIYTMRGGTVYNCHATSSATSGNKAGLIYETKAGNYTCYITKCTNRCNISGVSIKGGIVSQVGSDYNYIDSCHNYGNISSSSFVAGIVAQNTNNTLPKLYVTNCSNRGNITCAGGGENAAAGIVASLGGYRSHTSTATCDIQYCFNTGKITCNADRMAGILASYGTNHHVKYCYNLGELEAQGENNRQIRINGVSYAIDAQSCFNAGKITSTSTLSPLYAVAPNINTSTNFRGIACFNAGDLFSKMYEARALYPADGSSTSYNIGRIEGYASRIGGKYFDVTRVPSYANAILGGATAKTTTQLAATGVFSADKWVCEAGYYPRIKGLDTLTISRVLSMPIYFADGDNVDHVTQNFTVRRGWGVKWIIKEGTSEATISDTISTDNNLQTVTLKANRSYQNIVLAAQKGDSIYYTITLIQVPPTPARPLTVKSLADLNALRDGINSNGPFTYKDTIVPAGAENTTFIVTQDFSISGESNWTPIGDGNFVFKGVFDGNNKTISGLKQSSKTYFGLFGNVSGTVKDLTLSGVSITGSTHGGALCYMLMKGGTLSNCKAEGKMSNVGVSSSSNTVYAYVGGLVARSYGGTITHCVNGMDIESKDKTRVGGIVAYTEGSTSLQYCENAGNISNTFYIGGISGYGGIIKYCVNYGNITGTSMSVQIAGIGLTSSTITGCVNSGRIAVPLVSTTCFVAGVGYDGTIKSSYNVGEIVGNNATATYGVGKTCQFCYNAAKVSGNNVYAVGSSCTNCFYDSQMSLLTDSRATAKTTAEMCALTSSNLGSDFSYEANMYPRVAAIDTTPASWATAAPIFLANGEDVSLVNTDFTYGGCTHNVVWTTNDNSSHSISSCTAIVSNPGLPTDSAKISGVVYKVVTLNMKMDSYVIKDATELAHFRDGINSGVPFYYHPARQVFSTQDTLTGGMQVPANGLESTFKLLNDIDLSNAVWTPIGSISSPFKGVFDGNGKTIRNFKLSNVAYTGLFGDASNAVIQKLIIEGASGESITKTPVGIVAGRLTATTVDSVYINNCSIASTNSSGTVGGLAGAVTNTKINDIHVSGSSISGTTKIGGVLGTTTGGGITNCSVTNTTVHGSSTYIGGLVGTMSTNGSSIPVTNVTMVNNNVDGTNFVAGLIASTSRGNGTQTLTNIKVLGGTVAGASSVAGVVAVMCNSSYTNLYCSATVTGTGDKVAGIVANGNGSMTGVRWVFTGTVSGQQYVGGLIGYPDAGNDNQDIRLSNSINAGTVTGTNYVGGIRGREYHTPSNLTVSCINIGNVTGNMWVGGIVGYSQGNSYYCMNAGIVSGNQYVGGIVGHQSNYTAYNCKAHDCVSVGQVYGTANVGNVTGYYESGTVEKCYYDKQVSPEYLGIGSTSEDVAGVAVGKNTSEMLNTTLSMTSFTAASGLYPRTTDLKDSVAALVAASPVNLTNDKTAYTIPGDATYAFTPSTANGVVWTSEETALRNTNGTFSPKAAGGDVLTATKGDYAKHLNVTVGISKEFPCIIKNHAELAKFTQYVNSGNTFYYNTAAADQNPETFS
ncbi:MAG: hypothetical protein CW341_07550, partial [Bacteroidetes bacterium]|nr:hypothetical protein [Bacteroidota bacterium]